VKPALSFKSALEKSMIVVTSFVLQPEFFALLGIDLFLLLSLLSCLFDQMFPKAAGYFVNLTETKVELKESR
jgi:hypothetical protein